MTLYEFSRLAKQQQYSIAFNKGTFIEHYFTGYRKFSLYAVEKFFVEVEYSSKENKIIGIKTFKTGKELFKYSPIKILKF
ncbi:hypothetical protein [Gramella sp. KN1008]|uniref:hypothetical protein n=1 Tax=Gramella sp. KN1008 TaxID=2529298 RepID=UPI00103AC524|nr:hypothetical protein [Gramella sp. KN1008]TBW28275.1 hypothetical protein EZJ28_05880 [Gramella sp. KN1008]